MKKIKIRKDLQVGKKCTKITSSRDGWLAYSFERNIDLNTQQKRIFV